MNWKAVLWILATIVCDICAMYFGYVSLWVLAFFLTLILFLAIILIFCSFWILSFRQVLLHPAVEKHAEAQLAVQCQNRGFFLYPDVQLHYLHGERKKIAVYPGFQEQKVGYVYGRKGRYEVGLQKIVIYEPFGIFCRRIHLREPEVLSVLPRATLLYGMGQEDVGKSSETGTKKKLIEDRSTISDMREYEYGDTLNSINWKATAKRNEVVVNRYENEFCPKVFVYVDGSFQGMENAEAGAVLDDYACDLALSQVKSVLQINGIITLFYGGQNSVVESGMVKAFEEYGIYLTQITGQDEELDESLLLEKTLFQKDVYTRAVFYLQKLTAESIKILMQLENQHVKTEVYRIAFRQSGMGEKPEATLLHWQEGVDIYG